MVSTRQSFLGIVCSMLHGVFFFALAIVAYLHFGRIFLLLSGVMMSMSIFSLHEAWIKVRREREKQPA